MKNDEECFEKYDEEIYKLKILLNILKQNGKKVFIYGASPKESTLLKYAKISSDLVEYVVTNSYSEEQMRELKPDYLLVEPWHFKKEICEREQEFLKTGGTLIFPLPKVECVYTKPHIFVTGVCGQIGKSVCSEFADYTIIGLTKEIPYNKHQNVIYVKNDIDIISLCLSIFSPQACIHLSSITRTETGFSKENQNASPLEVYRSDALVITEICDSIVKNALRCSVFNASSSEIYKGYGTYCVREDDNKFLPYNPYSIGKVLTTSLIQYYRKNYGKHFSNGIIFTTESQNRSNEFLLKKVSLYLAKLKEKISSPQCCPPTLNIGSLCSSRIIQHTSDVAKAIKIIFEQPKGDDYIICGLEQKTCLELVLELCRIHGFEPWHTENSIFDKTSGRLLISYSTSEFSRQSETHISGRPEKLLSLGWKPMSTENVLKSLM